MEFNRQFKGSVTPYVTDVSSTTHVKFDPQKPISIAEMMRRAQNGIPLSVYQPKNDNIPINNRFYNDDFDVLDLAIKNDKRISEESRRKQLEENAERKKQNDEFLAWKQEQARIAKEKATYVEKNETL